MPEPKNVLIAGAGVAGPALALLLIRAGHKCTVVERAPAFRASGQQIDVDGEALKVLKIMDVYDDFVAHRVEDKGVNFVDANDNVTGGFPAGEALVKELEIMRSDVARIIYEKTSGAEYIFGEYIDQIKQHDSGVTARFANTKKERTFDLIVAADGLRSRTRREAFEPSNTKLVSLGMYTAFLSLPYQESDGDYTRWYSIPKGRSINIRPNRKNGTSSAYLGQVTPNAGELAKGSLEEQKQRVISNFRGVGWESDRVLGEIERTGADFYAQEIAQAKSESLLCGRVVLLGDAGYCPTPLSGQGTSIALIGAYILAGCIATYSSVEEALTEYEKQVRPFVDRAQEIPPGAPWIVNPQSEVGVRVLNLAVGMASFVMKTRIPSALGKLGGLLPSFGSKDPVLPEYSALALDDSPK